MATKRLESVNPLTVLNRGYSILLDQNDQAVRSNQQVKVGDQLKANLAEGELMCAVTSV